MWKAEYMATVFAAASLMLYTEGVENVAWVEGYSQNNGVIVKNQDHFYLKAGPTSAGWSNRTLVTDKGIDLTNVNTLYIEWENTGNSSNKINSYFVVILGNKMHAHSVYTVRTSLSGAFPKQVTSLDVSALTGKHYIRFHAQETAESGVDNIFSELKVYKVWGV